MDKIKDYYGNDYMLDSDYPANYGAIFHIGDGKQNGFYQKGGVHKFIMFGTYDDLLNIVSDYIFIVNRDSSGRYCKPYYVDGGGNRVAEVGDTVFDFDGTYDTTYFVPLQDLRGDDEIDAMLKAGVLKNYD